VQLEATALDGAAVLGSETSALQSGNSATTTLTFVATSTQTTLQFDDVTVGNNGNNLDIWLDNVVVDDTGLVARPADNAGTTGDDQIDGTAQAEFLRGDLGNDTISGNGGADVILGDAGDDVIGVNADNLAALASGAQNGILASVDGGSGLDTLALDGSGLVLNFDNIDDGRVEGIEAIDISGSGMFIQAATQHWLLMRISQS